MGCKKQLRRVFLPWVESEQGQAQKINGAVDVSASLLPLVAISVAEAELGGTFYNAKTVSYYASPWKKWVGNKTQPRSLFDNNTASGICNSTIKRQRSGAMNGQYFWLIDQVNLNTYRIKWAPGLEVWHIIS